MKKIINYLFLILILIAIILLLPAIQIIIDRLIGY